jgi:cell division protein FtsA
MEIEVPSISGGPPEAVSRQVICGCLEPRVEEIMGFINHEFISAGYEGEINEVVVTGGASLLEGVPELSQEIFNRPVRRGYPAYVGGLSELVSDPKYATAIGLVLYGLRNREMALNVKRGEPQKPGLLKRILGRIKEELGLSGKQGPDR